MHFLHIWWHLRVYASVCANVFFPQGYLNTVASLVHWALFCGHMSCVFVICALVVGVVAISYQCVFFFFLSFSFIVMLFFAILIFVIAAYIHDVFDLISFFIFFVILLTVRCVVSNIIIKVRSIHLFLTRPALYWSGHWKDTKQR